MGIGAGRSPRSRWRRARRPGDPSSPALGDARPERPEPTAGRAPLLVRQGQRWLLAPFDADVSTEVALDEVLDRFAAPPAPDLAGFAPLPDALVISATWTYALELGPVGVRHVDGEGRAVTLDAHDLRLIEDLPFSTSAGAAVADTPVPDAARRLSRLARIGLVHERVDLPAADEPAAVAPAPRHDPVAPTGGPHPGGPEGRIPVYAVWHTEVGPLLALGMLTAAARAHDGGALAERFEIRRPEESASFLADLAERTGPAVLFCSDYVWSLESNLATARRAKALNPELVVIHGGPSSPKYEPDAERFLDEHGDVADILTRGEGEELICELLTALGESLPCLDHERLRSIDGLTFRVDGETVRTPDRDRITDLEALPSPYLTGEFDHIDARSWNTCLSVESNRGCPYSCAFCDWGSSTMSRIRMFPIERVASEIEWAADRGVVAINIPDANFGIMSRAVKTAEHIAAVKARTGFPSVLVFYPAKNTTKHFLQIMDVLGEAGITSAASLSLQTVDEASLAALDRANISTDHFVALAADYRRRRHPLQGDLLIGIPGQTPDSYRRDLQFMFDQEILVRTWPVQILPNAPMNDPEYRALHQIESDEEHLIRATASFTDDDRRRMLRLRKVDIICERLGLLRHVLRHVQWEHGIDATVVMDRLVDLAADGREAYPHLTWTLNYFDLHPVAPVSWSWFYRDVAAMLASEFGVARSSALDAVLALNQFLMPAAGRSFPDSIELEHDYLAYFRDATRGLIGSGHPTTPTRPLASYGPATFTVDGDPAGLCRSSVTFEGDSRNERMQGEFQIGSSMVFELQSPLARNLPGSMAAGLTFPSVDPDEAAAASVTEFPQDAPSSDGRVESVGPTPVSIGSRR